MKERLVYLFYSWVCLFVLCFLCVPLISRAVENDKCRMRCYSGDVLELMDQLEQKGLDISGINRRLGFVEIIEPCSVINQLKDEGMSVQIVDCAADRPLRAVPSGYHSYDELVVMMQGIENNHPGIARLIDIGSLYGTGNTYEDRKMLAMKISDNVGFEEDEHSIYILSLHHAREITTSEYALWCIDKLTALYDTDPQIKAWVDRYQIYIGVVWNPDGHMYCFEVDDWWRKNRKPAGGTYYGIDLNRNFDFRWDGPVGGSTDPSSDTYRGPYPNSEEETQAEIAFAYDFHFAKVLDFHSFGSEILYTYYNSADFPTLLENWFETKAIEMSYAFNYDGYYRKASAEGEHYQWEICNLGSFSYLVETGTEFQPPFATAVSEFSDHIWPGITWFLDHEIPLEGHISNAVTGAPLRADIAISGIDYSQGEVRQSESRFGRYHYFLPPGNYEITFSCSGYASAVHMVTIVAGISTVLDVQLEPDSVVPSLSLPALFMLLAFFSLFLCLRSTNSATGLRPIE